MKLFFVFFLFCIFNTEAVNYAAIITNVIQNYINEAFRSAKNETECIKQLKIYSSDVNHQMLWASQMLDATGKLQHGILEGNVYFVGSFDQCLKINVMRNNSNIKGQYCRATLSSNSILKKCVKDRLTKLNVAGLGKTSTDVIEQIANSKWDFCFPAICKAKDLQQLWDYTEMRYEFQIHFKFDDYFCASVDSKKTYSNFDIAAISIFSVIGLMVVLSTLYDILIFQTRKDKQLNLFMAFSYYTNIKLLFSVSKQKDGRLACLDGMKVISLFWIILGHRFMFNFIGISVNALYIFEWLKHHENMFILGALATVDTFFLTSGFLLSYLIMSAAERGIDVPLLMFFSHRLLRFTPGLAAVLLFYLGIIKHMDSGPYWFYVDELLAKPCKESWWSIILYVQNYVYPETRCLIQSWYIAVDTQLYLLSPIIIIPLKKWPKVGISFTAVLIISSAASTVYLVFYYEFDSISMEAMINFMKYLYVPTHTRMVPWLVGIIFGYFLFEYRNKKIMLCQTAVVLSWLLSLGLMLIVLYGYIAFAIYKFTVTLVAIFLTLSRILWSVSLCWIIFACFKGYGGSINTFLSLPIFTILTRMSYSLYLTHFMVLSVFQARTRITAYIDNLVSFHSFWGDLVFSICIAFVWTLTFESPMIMLEKIIFRKKIKEVTELQNKYTETQ